MLESPPGECLKTDLTTWEIGPYHGALPGAMRLLTKLDGEVIVSGRVETGFLHRGLEKAMELHSWSSAIAYTNHVDPEGAIFGELSFCLAVEEMAEITPPPRAQAVRVLLCELTRIASHMAYLVRMSRIVGADTFAHYVLRDRERVLDLFELLTGSRFSVGFSRFGGVCADVTEGFIERIFEVCELIRVRQKEYNDLLTFNQAFLKRVSGIGVIDSQMLARFGVSGPNARAAGAVFDVRRAHPYSGYAKIDFDVPGGKGEMGFPGDAHDRFLVRLREISQSVRILRDVAESIPAGPFIARKLESDFCVPAGEAYVRVESARGLFGCHLISDGARFPARVQFRTPTTSHLLLIPALIRGSRIEDLPVILASLDLSIAEADR